MFELMPDEAKRELLDEMHPISMVLMQDQFGSEWFAGRIQRKADPYCRLCGSKRHHCRFGRRPLEGRQPSQGSDVSQLVNAYIQSKRTHISVAPQVRFQRLREGSGALSAAR